MKEKTLTRTLAFITAFVMILAIAPTNLGMSGLFDGLALKASAAYGTDIFGTPTTHSDYTVYELQSGTYTLNSDVLLDHCLYIPAGQMVTINLNGYTLDRGLSSATEGTVDGSVIWNEGYLNLKSTDSYNGVITGGYAVNGGGINNVTTSGSPITGYLSIDKVTIRGNKASQNGGGIFFDGATIIDGISNCRIMNNEAGDCGGGIYISADKTMTLTNTSVTENSADENGGGIYQGGTLSLSTTINNYAFLLSDNLSGSLPNNVYLPSGKTITLANNLTDQSRIYVYAEEDYQTVTTNWNSYGPKNVQASEIIMSDKGGIAVVDEVSGEVLFTADDSTIVGSWSSLQAEISNAAEPKSIALIRNITAGANDTQIVIPNGKDISINLNGFTISRNLESAQQDGRVFYVQAGGKLTLNSLNSAGTVTGGNTTGNGGAILNEGTLSLSYVYIKGNNAVANGGGIYTALGATTTLADYVYVIYNTAGNNGGGIANDGTVNASYLAVTNNQSSGNGGGIWQNGLFNVKNRIIVNENTKTSSANNIYLKSGKVVTLVDKLTNYTVTEMGITMENTAYNVTSGWSTYNDANIAANYFTSDNSALFAEQFGSEIVIGVPYLERYSNGDSQKRAVNNYTELTSATTTLGSGWYIVSGNVTNNNRIYVSNGQTANIILKDGATLTCPKGIAVNAGTTLNIYGQDNDSGKLVAHSDEFNAAIGSDDQDEDSGENGGGNINIYGGTIEATSGDDAAGIGGGNEAGNGNIRIYGGNITAIGATNGAGIGSGDEPETAIGSITIYGGEITASSIKCGAGIGGGFGANGGNITIYGGTITATGGAFAAGIGGGDKGESGNVSIYGGSVTAVGGELAAGIGSGRFKGRPNITIGGNAVVNATGGECAAGIGEGYGCDSTTENGYIAINGGTVTATGGGESAGIGGGEGTNTKCNITITDGTVYAYGGDRSTKHSYTGDTYGCAAGIGAGCFHNGGGDYAGSIKISGGEVHAYSSRQLVYDIKEDCGGAGIGAAYMGNLTGSVEITGGVVEAVGKFGGAAIGAGAEEEIGGRGGECEGTVTITGGRVILSIDSENECVFIGHGCDGSEDGTLVLGNNMKVCFDESAPQIAPLRYSTCRTESNDSLIIAECDHPHITYTSTSTTHTAHCYYCNTVFNAETHDPDDNNKCTVCGYQGALYTVSFNANGASGTMQSVTIVPDNNYVLPECTFTPQESKRFKCWSVGGIEKAVGDEITVSANTEVKAIWESLFTVAFNTDGGGEIASQTVVEGNTVAKPDDPQKDGFDFVGWYLGANAYNFATPVNADITLTAHWEEIVGEIIGGYYYEDGEIVKSKGVVKIDGYYYYVGMRGQIFKGSVYVTEEKSNGYVEPAIYAFGEDGKLLELNDTEIINGFYYENGVITKGVGLVLVDGDYYYITKSGKAFTGSIYITEEKSNGYLEPAIYAFGEDGKLLEVNDTEIINGFYYENGVITKGVGLVLVDGDYYYIAKSGKAFTGSIYITEEKSNGYLEPAIYAFGDDGKLIG